MPHNGAENRLAVPALLVNSHYHRLNFKTPNFGRTLNRRFNDRFLKNSDYAPEFDTAILTVLTFYSTARYAAFMKAKIGTQIWRERTTIFKDGECGKGILDPTQGNFAQLGLFHGINK